VKTVQHQFGERTLIEIRLLDRLVRDKNKGTPQPKSLFQYIVKAAKLGGYLARSNDFPPGITVMWRGLSRLTDIELGASLATEFMGD
jgi:hypothetical protein